MFNYRLIAAQIPIQSQIMAIADIYDALTASDRPYKPKLSLDRTISIMCVINISK